MGTRTRLSLLLTLLFAATPAWANHCDCKKVAITGKTLRTVHGVKRIVYTVEISFGIYQIYTDGVDPLKHANLKDNIRVDVVGSQVLVLRKNKKGYYRYHILRAGSHPTDTTTEVRL